MVTWKKVIKDIEKDEEKVVFKIHKFKVRKKLFFSMILTIMIMMIGISKVESLHEINEHVSLLVLLITFCLCFTFIFFTVMRKNLSFFSKQISLIFISLLFLVWLFTLNSKFNMFDISFVSIIATTVAAAIYDLF